MGIVLALALAAPVVGVQTDGIAPCDTSAFARDLRALRPELETVPLDVDLNVPAGAWRASIEGIASDQPLLRVTGNPTPLLRPLPGQDCKRVVEIAASMVDGLLDQLPATAFDRETRENPSALRPTLSAWAGAGTLQGPIRWVASFALGARVGLGSWEAVGVADLGLLASIPLMTIDEGPVGRYEALPFDFELGGGWSPRLGRGRLSLDLLVGLALASVSADASTGAQLFETYPQVAVDFFASAAAGYTFDLPARFFAGLRAEERLAPQQALSPPKNQVSVGVDGKKPGDQVVPRLWTFTSTVIFGWRFF